MFKIMTLNINYYGMKHGLWIARREIIREVIQSTQPDLIALQAVEADPAVAEGLDQAMQLARLLPDYRYVFFQPAQRTPTGGSQGSAFLSRRRMDSTNYLPLTKLPGLDDASARVLLVARLDLATGPLHIFNGHFSWVAEQARANMSEALPYMENFVGRALLVGDLNNTPEADVLQTLKKQDWIDAWAALHVQQDGFTFESNHPTIRIDYAWANPELESFVQDIQVIADKPSVEGARASDHFGLLVTLNLAT